MPKRTLIDSVNQLERELAIQRAVLTAFPDAKIVRVYSYANRKSLFGGLVEFHDKNVNKVYTKFDFERSPYGVYVVPYCEVSFEHLGTTEVVKVHSTPKKNRLVYLRYNYKGKSDESRYTVKFSRIAINLKNNEFKEDMLNSCRAEIMTFVKNNGQYKMDDKHLEPRLKKLLIFT